jgi:hypothetical protein
MKIQREKLLEMNQLFNKLADKPSSVKFHYIILKNKRLLVDEIDSIQKANEPSEGYYAFEKARVDLCTVYSQKDDDGKTKIEHNSFVLVEDKEEEFNTKVKELQEEYQDVLDAFQKSRDEFSDLLQSDVEIDFVKIPMSTMPNTLLGEEVEILFDIIEEDL